MGDIVWVVYRVERERRAKLNKAAGTIQKCFRSYVRRMYANAAARARKARELLCYQAVTMINRIARGRLARRVYQTEKHLLIIKDAHPLLLGMLIL